MESIKAFNKTKDLQVTATDVGDKRALDVNDSRVLLALNTIISKLDVIISNMTGVTFIYLDQNANTLIDQNGNFLTES